MHVWKILITNLSEVIDADEVLVTHVLQLDAFIPCKAVFRLVDDDAFDDPGVSGFIERVDFPSLQYLLFWNVVAHTDSLGCFVIEVNWVGMYFHYWVLKDLSDHVVLGHITSEVWALTYENMVLVRHMFIYWQHGFIAKLFLKKKWN